MALNENFSIVSILLAHQNLVDEIIASTIFTWFRTLVFNKSRFSFSFYVTIARYYVRYHQCRGIYGGYAFSVPGASIQYFWPALSANADFRQRRIKEERSSIPRLRNGEDLFDMLVPLFRACTRDKLSRPRTFSSCNVHPRCSLRNEIFVSFREWACTFRECALSETFTPFNSSNTLIRYFWFHGKPRLAGRDLVYSAALSD